MLGDAEVMPAADLKFQKTEEINVVFQVYGAKFGADREADVTVDYVFLQKDGTGEKPFNKTPPQRLTPRLCRRTSTPRGPPAGGGQAVPLATFPEGDFRLEIKITDNKTSKSITRDVFFSVVPASSAQRREPPGGAM